jgi:sensor histidine kinase YesM
VDTPVLQKKNYVAVYLLVWLIIVVIHAAVLFFIYGISIKGSVADAAVFNILFALAGYTLWFVIRYNLKEKPSGFDLLFQHLMVAMVIIATWFFVSYYTLSGVLSNDNDYLQFLQESIPWRIITGFFYYIVFVLVYYVILYYEDLQEKLKRESELQKLVKEAELDALKSQINPHFLFNSLNSVSSLTLASPDKAQEMVIKLSDFLRYSLSSNRKSVTTIENEFGNIKRYLDIEKVRFGKRLKFIAHIPDKCLNADIPSLILQPLIENAIKHGVYNSSEEVTIKLSCTKNKDFIIIEISNDYDPGAIRKKGEGIGLKNIRNRLQLIYQRQDLLVTEANNNIFKATLKLPIQNRKNHEQH